jgi:predicted PurR-regulated permease PerM
MSATHVPRFFQILMAAATVLLGFIVFPIVRELFLAAVLAGVLWRPQQWLARHLGGRRGIAAGIITALVAMVMIGPVATLGAYMVRDGDDALAFVASTAKSGDFTRFVGWLPEGAQNVINDGIARIPTSLEQALGMVGAANGQAVATASAAVALAGAFMLIALFSLLVSGQALVDWIDEASPLGRGRTNKLLTEFKNVAYAVIVSTIITSAVQALAALAGYLITGVPSAPFFALTTFFFAFIPAIGAGVVCVLAAALLFLTGHPYMALFLALWGIVVVGLADNVVRPLLIKRGMGLHGTVVFFALIGGIAAFGAIGLLLGPLIVAFFLALVRMYHDDFAPERRPAIEVPSQS